MASPEAIIDVASQATTLSSRLRVIDESVRQSAEEIDDIANDIALLCVVLFRLYEAMTRDPTRYTESFQEDLEEILQELRMLFEEIGDVGLELEKDDGLNTGAVKRFFKKAKINHLLKHLATLATTLAVMKTVLLHGCEFNPDK